MDAADYWRWIARFAQRLVELRPVLWPSTATAIAVMSFERYAELDPEQAAQRYVEDNPEDGVV